jgi:hypothetical protein
MAYSAQLRSMFVRRERRPSIQQMWTIYREMSRTLPAILRAAGPASLYSARVFKDLCVLASASADRIVV